MLLQILKQTTCELLEFTGRGMDAGDTNGGGWEEKIALQYLSYVPHGRYIIANTKPPSIDFSNGVSEHALISNVVCKSISCQAYSALCRKVFLQFLLLPASVAI